MRRACSSDLRECVMKAVEASASCRAAALAFRVALSLAIKGLARLCEHGECRARNHCWVGSVHLSTCTRSCFSIGRQAHRRGPSKGYTGTQGENSQLAGNSGRPPGRHRNLAGYRRISFTYHLCQNNVPSSEAANGAGRARPLSNPAQTD